MLEPIDLSSSTEDIVEQYFSGLHSGGGKSHIKGGQTAANEALQDLDITRYASDRSEVLPLTRRGATVLSPYIRHNLLTLKQVWAAVKDAPYKDREKFQDELMWQEYARHLYAQENTVAVTYAPVPSFAKFEEVAELHPFPWLRTPHDKNIQSFIAWRQKLG